MLSPFLGEETGAQADDVTCPRTHGQEEGELGYEFTDSGSTACTLPHSWNPKEKTKQSGGVLGAAGLEPCSRHHLPSLSSAQGFEKTQLENL